MEGIYPKNKQFIWTIYVNFRGVSPWNSKSMYLKTIPMEEFIQVITFGFIINFGLVKTYLALFLVLHIGRGEFEGFVGFLPSVLSY